ncbi:MAG: hypothetical protein H6825_08540 [Planctomycetes bacterium]|nr:hypothetical protein [Planctomycetota bacterium]
MDLVGSALAMLLVGTACAPVRAQAASGRLASRDAVGEPITVTGRVLDLSGAPIAGARAWFVPNGTTLAAQGFEPRDVQPICDRVSEPYVCDPRPSIR